jgi:uncharacterized protein (TIGR00297 family)
MNSLAALNAAVLLSVGPRIALYALLTAIFASLGWAVRGVTARGALAGAGVCFALLWGAGTGGFLALFTVFQLTWVSTRIGFARKQRLGTAEARGGRNALQVLANLGVAAGCATLYSTIWHERGLLAAMVAALAEAAADTVSSEIGQAVGGTPRLITSWRQVSHGTDGAVSLFGTLAGIAAAVTVAWACVAGAVIRPSLLATCAVAGVLGMFADSFLGATLERGEVLENNAVNFVATLISALVALLFSWI